MMNLFEFLASELSSTLTYVQLVQELKSVVQELASLNIENEKHTIDCGCVCKWCLAIDGIVSKCLDIYYEFHQDYADDEDEVEDPIPPVPLPDPFKQARPSMSKLAELLEEEKAEENDQSDFDWFCVPCDMYHNNLEIPKPEYKGFGEW